MNATYETIERCIEIHSELTEEQFDRCCVLASTIASYRPSTTGTRYWFHVDDEAHLLALQDYVIEQGLPHTITTTREWKP